MPGQDASHLFQVISRRYEHGSIILTTNRGIADGGQFFEDTTVAAAILDRLLHHATVLSITSDSYACAATAPPSQPPTRPTGPPTGEEFPSSQVKFPSSLTVVRVWDLAAGEQPHALEGHNSMVRGVAFAADGLARRQRRRRRRCARLWGPRRR
jgi:hypothetical protein